MTTTLDPLSTVRADRAAHPEWTVRDLRRDAAEHGVWLRFDTLPAPTCADRADAPGVVVIAELFGLHCAGCGLPAERMVLHPSGLIATEHAGHAGSPGWACAGGAR